LTLSLQSSLWGPVQKQILFSHQYFCLALGITGALLLFLWIGKEFTYDQFHVVKDRVYKDFEKIA
jgi:hypothetical protein